MAKQDEKLKGDWTRLFLIIRQAFIMAIGAIEDHQGMPRSITPQRKRKKTTYTYDRRGDRK